MVTSRSILLALAAATVVNSSPCPFGNMAEEGWLSPEDEAKFYFARRDGSSAVQSMMEENKLKKREAEEFDLQKRFYDEQIKRAELPLGGGLLNGQLQPFTGALSGIALPKFVPPSLSVVPDKAHPFMQPKKTDVRGMCPTLNTMANHGYINRNGITTFAQATNACQMTLGFGFDTCAFLSGLGLIAGGDIPTGAYSIGGADSRVPNTIGPALGISKHGVFEVDQSIARTDTYFGNQASFNLARWNRWSAIATKNGDDFGFTTMNEERQASYEESRTQNPNFNAEIKHFAVTLAERVFIPRALPNFTHPYLADHRNIAPFYLNETFPKPNWFKRGTSYSLAEVGADIVTLYAMGPTEIGHNVGKDNFVGSGTDFANLTPSQATCLLLDSILDLTAGSVAPTVYKNYDLVLSFINGGIKPFFGKKCYAKNQIKPGPDVVSKTAGVNAKSCPLINGRYHC